MQDTHSFNNKSIDSILNDILQKQNGIWMKRNTKASANYCRTALLQFDIGNSSYFPVEKQEGNKEKLKIDSLLVNLNDHENEKIHIEKILNHALEACKSFNVDLLLLPEYSIHPEHIEFIINRLKVLESNMLVWAGTFRINDPTTIKLLEKFSCNPKNNISGLPLFSSVLCIISQKGIVYFRGKKYPSIAAKEDIAPWTGDLSPLFDGDQPHGKFVTELICSEIFMATSPANIKSLKWHHEMLRTKYGLKFPAQAEAEYKNNLVVKDLLNSFIILL